jgi:hypothetical protein
MLKNKLIWCMIFSLAHQFCIASCDVVQITPATPSATAEDKSENSQNYNNGYSTQKYDKKYNGNNRYNGPTLTEKAEKWHMLNEEHFAVLKQELLNLKQGQLDIKENIEALRQEFKRDIAHSEDLMMAQHAEEVEPIFAEENVTETEKVAEAPAQTPAKKMKKSKAAPQPITAEELTEIEDQV